MHWHAPWVIYLAAPGDISRTENQQPQPADADGGPRPACCQTGSPTGPLAFTWQGGQTAARALRFHVLPSLGVGHFGQTTVPGGHGARVSPHTLVPEQPLDCSQAGCPTCLCTPECGPTASLPLGHTPRLQRSLLPPFTCSLALFSLSLLFSPPELPPTSPGPGRVTIRGQRPCPLPGTFETHGNSYCGQAKPTPPVIPPGGSLSAHAPLQRFQSIEAVPSSLLLLLPLFVLSFLPIPPSPFPSLSPVLPDGNSLPHIHPPVCCCASHCALDCSRHLGWNHSWHKVHCIR